LKYAHCLRTIFAEIGDPADEGLMRKFQKAEDVKIVQPPPLINMGFGQRMQVRWEEFTAIVTERGSDIRMALREHAMSR
jgi:hypothetical protein